MIDFFGLKIDVAVFSAIIGVVGTLLGTTLGWVLSEIKIGRLSFRIIANEKLDYENAFGKKSELVGLSLNILVSVQNTRDSILVIRNPMLTLKSRNKIVGKIKLLNLEDLRSVDGVFRYHADFDAINILGQEAIDLKCTAYINKDLALRADRLLFTYTNKRFKEKNLLIKKVNYKTILLGNNPE